MSLNPIVSVFNHVNNFSGNIELNRNDVSIEQLRQLLSPHRVSESCNTDSRIITVKPFIGMEVNETGFFKLIQSMLSRADLIEVDEVFETGYGNLRITSSVTTHTSTVQVSTKIYNGANTVVDLLNVVDFSMAESVADAFCLARQTTMCDTAGLIRLLELSGEWVHDRLTIMQEKITGASAVIPPQPEVAQAEATQPETTQAPPALARPNVTEYDILKEEVARTRAVVDDVLVSTGVIPATSSEIKAYLDVRGVERDTPIRVVIELNQNDYLRLKDEGIVSTILQAFDGAGIYDEVLVIPSTNGYLMALRNAISDHGVTPKSITPRSITGIDINDPSFINLL